MEPSRTELSRSRFTAPAKPRGSAALSSGPRASLNESGDSPRGPRTWRGSVSLKQAPRPGSPHASSQPPCSLASSSEIDNPRPVPPVVRARAGSARQNLLNTSDDSPGRRPTPKSRTVTATDNSFCPTSTSTPRASPCSTALSMRFRTIRSIRRASPLTRKRLSSSTCSSSEPGPASRAWATSPANGSTSTSRIAVPSRCAKGCARSMTRRVSSRTST